MEGLRAKLLEVHMLCAEGLLDQAEALELKRAILAGAQASSRESDSAKAAVRAGHLVPQGYTAPGKTFSFNAVHVCTCITIIGSACLTHTVIARVQLD